MKPNTYVKIVSDGIPSPIADLGNFMEGDEIFTLQENESVECRSSVLNDGNIIIFRDNQRNVTQIIHTPHTVYIQEQNKTIGTYRPFRPTLMGANRDGSFSVVETTDPIAVLPAAFHLEASNDLKELADKVITTLSALTPEHIEAAMEFDRFNIPLKTLVCTEPAFWYLQNVLYEAFGVNLTPVRSGKTRFEQDYFYIEYVQDGNRPESSKASEKTPDEPVCFEVN